MIVALLTHVARLVGWWRAHLPRSRAARVTFIVQALRREFPGDGQTAAALDLLEAQWRLDLSPAHGEAIARIGRKLSEAGALTLARDYAGATRAHAVAREALLDLLRA